MAASHFLAASRAWPCRQAAAGALRPGGEGGSGPSQPFVVSRLAAESVFEVGDGSAGFELLQLFPGCSLVVWMSELIERLGFQFVIGETKAPLAVALIISGAIGFVIGLALPRFRRGDRTD